MTRETALLSADETSEDVVSNPTFNLSFLRATDDSTLLGSMDRYQVTNVLGTGGMGIVLKAFDPELRRDVAIKVMRPEIAKNAEARHRFARESRALAAISNEHVISVHEVHSEVTPPYFVMPFLEGMTLSQLLDDSSPQSTEQILKIAEEATRGLVACHQAGLIHRDIKPSNLFREESTERTILIDFGLVRSVDGDTMVTQFNRMAGTPACMAPEQAGTEGGDERSDLFSLGCVFYELCTQLSPFKRGDVMSTLMAVSQHHPVAPHVLNEDIPIGLSQLIMRLIEKEPDKRPESAKSLLDELNLLTDQVHLSNSIKYGSQPTISFRKADTERQGDRNMVRLFVLAFLPLFLFGGIWLIIRDRDGEVKQRIMLDQGEQIEVVTNDEIISSRSTDEVSNESDQLIDYHRKAAEYVTQQGGTVQISYDHSFPYKTLKSSDEIPEKPFFVYNIALSNTKGIRTNDLVILGHLPTLTDLELNDTQVDSSILPLLKNSFRLRQLTIVNVPITLSDIANSPIRDSISALVMNAQQVDDWSALGHFKHIRHLDLWNEVKIDDLEQFSSVPSLRSLLIYSPKDIPLTVIESIQKKNPLLRIIRNPNNKPKSLGKNLQHESVSALIEKGVKFSGSQLPGYKPWGLNDPYDPSKEYIVQEVVFPKRFVFDQSVIDHLNALPILYSIGTDYKARNLDLLAQFLAESQRSGTIMLNASDLTDKGLKKLEKSRINKIYLGDCPITLPAIRELVKERPNLWIFSSFGTFVPQALSKQ
ncbi:serine/threonine-protein kinase [uncultured Rubinisphaera sp.]|uniref:serine/threonine protein kinase n=1 Tax=uncultured Rubinisphaera sp. TaxID=1678686 RepID=UPI0030DD320F